MRYGSICSGIEAATVAWHPLGWEPAFFSEIEAFPRAVLTHHYPHVPLHGDFTTIKENDYEPIDLLAGGTPCQDGSIGYSAGAGEAGKGFEGERTGLAKEFVRLADRTGARILVWENVPNLISSRHKREFIRFCNSIAECGYGYAWRVLDGADFGASKRPRIVLVAHRGGVAIAAKILLEPQGAGRDSAERKEAPPVLTARGGMALDDRTPCILDERGARRATPLEWERALGFPDNYTLIPYRGKPAADGPRYKAIGNSWAVPKFRWLGERIQMVENLIRGGL